MKWCGLKRIYLEIYQGISMKGDTITYQPIVIFGGYFSHHAVYRPMRDQLARLTGALVSIVDANPQDWVKTREFSGWSALLEKLDLTVRKAASLSQTGKITVIGHSMGGILARLYLSPEPFQGKAYKGLDYISHLITLGSPHVFKEGTNHGGGLPRWVGKRYPGTAFSPQVRYTSLAGSWMRGTQFGPSLSKIVYTFYDNVCGDGTAMGDGIVPVDSSILPGSQAIVLDGVSHFWILGEPWYGHSEVLPMWFPSIEPVL